MRTVALIPLRGGSKSIPNKNIKALCGRPLCAWVLVAATGARSVDRVFVSTDSEEISSVVADLDLGIEVIERPEALATDEASTESVMLHFMKVMSNFDLLLTIQATSPLLTSIDLDGALGNFATGGFDAMLSAVRVKRFFWTDDGSPINYDPRRRPRRQEFAGTLMENGAFYITKRSVLERLGCRLGGKIGVYEMAADSSVEIDEPSDWESVEKLLRQRVNGVVE